MARTARHSKREQQKAKRKAKRKEIRQNSNGQKAGSIAIHSRLPGLEGIAIGTMDVVVDARRKDQHPALISVAVHHREEQRTVVWTIETGFGGLAPRVGFKLIPDGSIENLPPTCWFADVDSVEIEDFAEIGPQECLQPPEPLPHGDELPADSMSA